MAESILTVKKRRTVRRGRLTTLKKQLDKVSAKDIRNLDLVTLNNLKRAIEKDSDHHQELQTRFEELLSLEDPEDKEQQLLTDEITSGEEHQCLYEEYLDTIVSIIGDYQLHKEAERLYSAYQKWAEVANPKAKIFLTESKEFITDFKDYLKRSEHRVASDVISRGREQLIISISDIHRQVHSIKDEPESPKVEPPPPREPVEHRTKFDIELPSFNGNPTEWSQFYSLFSTTLGKRGKHLTKEEKCCLLLKSLKDTQARELAQLNTSGDDGYNDAIEALIRRYGQARVVLPHHINKFKSHQEFTFTRESLLLLGKHHCSIYKAVKNLDVDLSTFIAAYAASQFDSKLTEEWIKYTATLSSLPTMEDLDGYVQSLVCRLPTSASNQQLYNSKSNERSNNSTFKSDKPKSKHNLNCILCHDSVHSLARCPVFKDYSPDRRGKVVRDKRWCTNCLHPSHTNQHCTSTFTCRQCNGKHHTLLHRGESTTDQPNLSSPSTTKTLISTLKPSIRTSTSDKRQPMESKAAIKPPTHAFLSTALVIAVNGGRRRTSRLALDSGSSTSLITESLASHLRLKRYPHHLALEGAYSSGASKHYVQTTLLSRHDPQQIMLKLSVVSKLPFATPPLRTEDISSDVNVKDLQLADSKFGGRLDILLGNLDACKCIQGRFRYFPTPDIAISPTIFGWTVAGPLDSGQTSKFLSIQTSMDQLHNSLQRLWELEQVPTSTQHSSTEELAVKQFEETHSVDLSGRYSVSLPRVDTPPELGQSKHIAVSRFHQNERSLIKKGKLTVFNASLTEYQTLDHAEVVPKAQLNNKPSYYLPVHGVFKDTSTTTKVRPVFDASAKSSNGVALNDLLLAGPNLYPLLTDILIQFRTHLIGFSADISKMFREILLNTSERDLHRFLMRDQDGEIKDFRMKRLTFGVKSSPFLATKVIQHLAEKFSKSHPIASKAILQHFYVDDFLSGSNTVEEAIHIREELCDLLQQAGMNLRKWRTSSQDFAKSIPDSLLESDNLTLADAPKALGIHWNVHKDSFNISIPANTTAKLVTKRTVASESAKVYDILGLFAPFIIRSKIMLQLLWKSNCSWDEEAPSDIRQLWSEWTAELPLIHQHSISRRYDNYTTPVVQKSLHGFSDASVSAYGAVVYLRQLHLDGQVSISIVISKARAAPLKAITIPRAELVAAHLLSQLLVYSAKLLDISSIDIHAWTDSTIVLCWIRKSPSSLQTFVANRIAIIQSNLPETPWRHVPTKENPADLLSRGVSASKLLDSVLWWEGPAWLSQTPTQWHPQQIPLPKTLPEQKAVTLTSIVNDSTQNFDLWSKYSSFHTLTRTLAWIKRFIKNSKLPTDQRIRSSHLQAVELNSAKNFIFQQSQRESYPTIVTALNNNRNLPKAHPLSGLNVTLNNNGLIVVSGRVRHKHRMPKQLVALSRKSNLTLLFVSTAHRTYNHPGVTALLAIIAEDFYIAGLKNQLKHISRSCTTCQKAYARPLQPPMGMLPSARTTPSPPFKVSGVDFAGPFTIRKGHTRKPVLVKSYVCLFVCFSTKAVHLELCADLSKEEFMAALRRFCARRGTPSDIHSDNGTNFVGAATELKQTQHLLYSSKKELSHFCSSANITWHFIPPRSPNFGGLWEAGVKQMKILLRKMVAPHPLRFEELYTILTEAEAILNSRPITPLDSTDPSDDLVLTPGHFLIGRPMKSPARSRASEASLSSLRRWSLVQRLHQDLWQSWQAWYLQTLTRRAKWHRDSNNIKVGDLVLVKDESLAEYHNWPLAKVIHLYRGDDGVARAVDIVCHNKTYKRAVGRLIPLFSSSTTSM